MPCFSVIRTRMTNGDLIEVALMDLGYKVFTSNGRIEGKSLAGIIQFRRASSGWTVVGDTRDLNAITRRYSELGVAQWALKRGFSVTKRDFNTETNELKIQLVNRRG